MYFISVHCRAGEHDKCRDGAAIQCPCSCGHKRFHQESQEQGRLYDQAKEDQP